MPPKPSPRRASLKQAAEYMGLSVDTVNRRIRDGDLTRYSAGKRTVRLDLNEIDAYLTRNTSGKRAT